MHTPEELRVVLDEVDYRRPGALLAPGPRGNLVVVVDGHWAGTITINGPAPPYVAWFDRPVELPREVLE